MGEVLTIRDAGRVRTLVLARPETGEARKAFFEKRAPVFRGL